MEIERTGDWMMTFTGRKFWPLDPRPEDFCLEDIAHALAMTCRFNGHCIKFYSVAEHSCHLFDFFSDPTEKKWAIIHDGPEAFINDMVSPLKKDMPEFKKVENRIMSVMAQRYGLIGEIPERVDRADKAIVRDELVNMRQVPAEWNVPEVGIGARIQCWDPRKAEREFLMRCHRIGIN